MNTINTPSLAAPAPVAQPGENGITLDQVIEIAGQAAEAESAPIQTSLARISERVGALETALAWIVKLETEISQLKKAA